ncbi:MAG: response regulator [Pseudomonadota bacterium]
MGAFKILVVEDEPDILHLISVFLRRRGHSVISAASGAEGVWLMHSESPHLLLTDKRLPDCLGYDLIELSKQLQANTTRMKSLLITGDDSESVVSEGGRPDGILLKPFGLRELGIAVDSLL